MTITKGTQQDLSYFPIERVRLQMLVLGHMISIVGLVLFGWTLELRTHIVGPEVALFAMGFGVTTAFNIINGLLIDLHRDQSATAALNFTRCLVSAIIPMCRAMNPGWAFTFLAFIYVALLAVVLWVMRDGMKWRQELAEKKRLQREKKENENEASA